MLSTLPRLSYYNPVHLDVAYRRCVISLGGLYFLYKIETELEASVCLICNADFLALFIQGAIVTKETCFILSGSLLILYHTYFSS